MNEDLLKDIIEWDIVNWSKALYFWKNNINLKDKHYSCLELGGRGGGLSLWLSLNKNKVICSDLKSPEEEASKLHLKYSCNNINYMSIDATNIPFENEFDIVIFKSILGGISRNGNTSLKKKTIDEIYKCLKPNGKLLFAENLEASKIHKFFRKKFVRWGNDWNYLKYSEIPFIFSRFEKVIFTTTGFLGTFGRNEIQRNLLGKFDNIIDSKIPENQKYIVYGIAEKNPKS